MKNDSEESHSRKLLCRYEAGRAQLRDRRGRGCEDRISERQKDCDNLGGVDLTRLLQRHKSRNAFYFCDLEVFSNGQF